MNKEKVILEEIKYWKKNQLLPDHYCDFLIALYTYGEGLPEETQEKSSSKFQIGILLDLLLLVLLLPLSFLLVQLFSNQTFFQVLSFSVILLIVGGHWYYFHQKQSIYRHIAIVLFMLIGLIGSTAIVYDLLGSGLWLNTLIALHGVGWVVVGYLKKMYYLIASGLIAMLLFIVLIVI